MDHIIRGTVCPLNSEAPVPVIEHNTFEFAPGGAANIARNLTALRVRVILSGLLGTDQEAAIIWSRMNALGVDTSGIFIVNGRPTTLRTHCVGNNERLLRIDREDTSPLTIPVERRLLEFVRLTLPTVGTLVLSDNGKGVFNSTVAECVIQMANAANKRVIVDPKGYNGFERYSNATVLTPDVRALRMAPRTLPRGLSSLNATDKIDLIARNMLERHQLDALVLTIGTRGLKVFDKHYMVTIPPTPYAVVDTRGAADCFLAGFIWALSTGKTILQAALAGNLARGIISAQVGMPLVGLDQLVAGFEQINELRDRANPSTLNKILDLTQLQRKVWTGRTMRLRTVFTSGCFDLLHGGHIDFLQEARSLGDRLIVGLNSDASIRRLKGPNRPIVREEQRAQLVSALACVDFVVLFDEDTALESIQLIHPNVLVFGGDEQGDEIVGRETVEADGGRVEVIPMTEGLSTTALVDSIVERHQSG